MLNSSLISEFGAGVLGRIELASLRIAMLVIAIIVVSVINGTSKSRIRTLKAHLGEEKRLIQNKPILCRILLSGFEIIVAAVVVHTVPMEATTQSIAVWGLLAVICMLLSRLLVVEIADRSPWQPEKPYYATL